MKWWQMKERDANLDRELRSDLELEEEEQRENGLLPEEARYAARRAFGNLQQEGQVGGQPANLVFA